MGNEQNETAIYRLQDDVVLSYDKVKDSSRILKLNDDDFYYEATLVAGEIVRKINGKDSFQEIVKNVASHYGPQHLQDIMSGANSLIENLLQKNLIERVK